MCLIYGGPPNKGHLEDSPFRPCREVVLFQRTEITCQEIVYEVLLACPVLGNLSSQSVRGSNGYGPPAVIKDFKLHHSQRRAGGASNFEFIHFDTTIVLQ